MSTTAIRVDELSKRYRIGERSYRPDRLREVIGHGFGSTLRAIRSDRRDRVDDDFWALRDISLDVQQGEVVGIIGPNGAGKSTLLKILARVTRPSAGRAEIRGRVGSLLEVGTGFQRELTGRENIYLNGAILGMNRREMRRKFDEIVEFAEISEFLDTPVKRYSSGMYMRLAFAVAAHLEPEILIVDEVLAVGDLAFQRKCLGKMRDISRGDGRTILFVSHSMDAILRLCSRSILLDHGRLVADGESNQIIAQYQGARPGVIEPDQWIDLTNAARSGNGDVRFRAVRYSSPDRSLGHRAFADGSVAFEMIIDSDDTRNVGSLAVSLVNQSGVKLVNADTVMLGQSIRLEPGSNHLRLTIDRLHLKAGSYNVGFWLADPLEFRATGSWFDLIESAFTLNVLDNDTSGLGMQPTNDGVVTCSFDLVNA